MGCDKERSKRIRGELLKVAMQLRHKYPIGWVPLPRAMFRIKGYKPWQEMTDAERRLAGLFLFYEQNPLAPGFDDFATEIRDGLWLYPEEPTN